MAPLSLVSLLARADSARSSDMDLDLGIMQEGVVELDPMSGRMVLRIPQEDGSNVFLDIQEELAKQMGKEVRFIVTPMASIAELAKLVDVNEI